MTFIKSGTPAFRKASIALFAAGFVTFSNLYTTQPLMPIFAKDFKISPTAASLTLSFSTAALAIAMIFAAMLSDAIGRKRIMGWSMIIGSILAFLTAFMPTFFLLLFMRAMLGAVFAGVPAIAMAYISEEFDKRSLGVAMGLYISGNSIGGLSGRLLTGLFTDLFNWQAALAIVGAISILFSVYFWLALPRPQNFSPKPTNLLDTMAKLGGHLKKPGLVYLFFIAFFLMGSFVTMFNYIGFLLTEPPYNVSQTVIGLIFLVYLTGTFSSTWMGKKADLKGSSMVIQQALILMIVGGIITLLPTIIIKIIGLAIFTFGFFGAHSVASRWVGERAKINKAQSSSLYLLFYYAGSSIVGAYGGYFWSGFAWIGVILLILTLLVAAIILNHLSTKWALRGH